MSSGKTYPIEPAAGDRPAVAIGSHADVAESVVASRVWCRRLAKSHYENFIVASILLPRNVRQPFYNIYAFCRTADDAADESPTAEIAQTRLNDLQWGIDAIFQGKSPTPASPEPMRYGGMLFPALAETVAAHQLPQQPFNDLLSAFRQDQNTPQYTQWEQLLDYCRRSANPVGRLVLGLADACDDQNAQLSDEICTGLQLVNFWQDVARDHAIGRVYLPADMRDRFGVTPQMLSQTSTPEPLRNLIAHLCDQTEAYFRRGLPLCDRVPGWLAGDVKLFAHGGLETLRAIRRIDCDVLRVRPTVGKMKQFSLVARHLMGLL